MFSWETLQPQKSGNGEMGLSSPPWWNSGCTARDDVPGAHRPP